MKPPSLKIEDRPIEALIPFANNSRTHSDEQVAQIAASIREFGFTNPVLIDAEDGIIAGHGRVLAAQKLGLADVPVMVARGWSANQIVEAGIRTPLVFLPISMQDLVYVKNCRKSNDLS